MHDDAGSAILLVLVIFPCTVGQCWSATILPLLRLATAPPNSFPIGQLAVSIGAPRSCCFDLLQTCPRTHAPQDVLVLGTSALQPGSIVEIRALGYMVMGEWSNQRGRHHALIRRSGSLLLNRLPGSLPEKITRVTTQRPPPTNFNKSCCLLLMLTLMWWSFVRRPSLFFILL